MLSYHFMPYASSISYRIIEAGQSSSLLIDWSSVTGMPDFRLRSGPPLASTIRFRAGELSPTHNPP